jgi:UPF0716 protein FxsA
MRQRIGWLGVGVLVSAVVELIVLIAVARLIGVGLTVLLVLATMLAGGWLLQREGLRAWRALRDATAQGRPVGPEASDGLVGLIGAVLLLVPGFVTDALGLVLLIPPVRGAVRGTVRRRVERRFSPAAAGDLFGPRQVRVRTRRGQVPPDEPIEGEIVD